MRHVAHPYVRNVPETQSSKKPSFFSIKVALALREPKAVENMQCFKVQKVVSICPVALMIIL